MSAGAEFTPRLGRPRPQGGKPPRPPPRSRGWGKKQEEGEKRKQEKGTVSRQVPSGCLHIVFHGDMPRAPRDTLDRNGGNPPFPARIREICGHGGRSR